MDLSKRFKSPNYYDGGILIAPDRWKGDEICIYKASPVNTWLMKTVLQFDIFDSPNKTTYFAQAVIRLL